MQLLCGACGGGGGGGALSVLWKAGKNSIANGRIRSKGQVKELSIYRVKVQLFRQGVIRRKIHGGNGVPGGDLLEAPAGDAFLPPERELGRWE